MGLYLLDGVEAAFNFQVILNQTIITAANATGASFPSANFANGSGVALSYQCVSRYCSIDFTRRVFEMSTFCNNGWVARRAGFKDLMARLDGFASKGLTISDPLALFAPNGSIPMVATFDTGCTISFMGVPTRNHLGISTQDASEQSIEFMQDASFITPATVWVTS